MKRIALREIALLTLPLVVLGVGLGLKGVLPRGANAPATPALKIKPLGIEVGDWEDVTPTPLDVALGYTKIIRAPFHATGIKDFPVPVLKTWVPFRALWLKGNVQYLAGKKWVDWTDRNGGSGIDQSFQQNSADGTDGYIVLKLPLGKLPHDIGRLRFTGRLRAFRDFSIKSNAKLIWPVGYTRNKGRRGVELIDADTPVVDISWPLKAASEKLPDPHVDHNTGFVVDNVAVRLLPAWDHEYGPYAEIEARANYMGGGLFGAPVTNCPDAFLRDDKGREWPAEDHYRQVEHVKGWCQGSDCKWQISLSRIPRNTGALQAILPVSAGDAWPVWITVPVRGTWEARTSKKLRILSTTFQTEAGHRFFAVRFRYLGGKELFAHGEALNGDWLAFNDNAFLQPLRQKTPESDEVWINWSQKLVQPYGGKTPWEMILGRVDCGRLLCLSETDYEVRFWPESRYVRDLQSRAHLIFKTEIGLVDDGFVHVECPIDLPAKLATPASVRRNIPPTAARPGN